MVKFPRELVELLGLPTPSVAPDSAFPQQKDEVSPGTLYRRANEEVAVSLTDPMPHDPGLTERALRGHRVTQNSLADAILQAGMEPLSPSNKDPDWDVAWWMEETLYVAEVKSVTSTNEERQLRLGLGQVLRYRQGASGPSVVAVLVAERRPSDESWIGLCEELQVELVWPETWKRLFTKSQTEN